MKTIIESYQAGLFQKKQWLPNIISGIIVGVVALPLAMAFAIASGAKPEPVVCKLQDLRVLLSLCCPVLPVNMALMVCKLPRY